MDSNGFDQQLELQRDSMFKDAVLRGAQEKAAAILKRAEARARRELAVAQRACEEADKDKIAEGYQSQARRETGTMDYEARRELLRYRDELVESVFAEVEGEVMGFVNSEAYPAWLARRLAAYGELLRAEEMPVVYLRGADMHLADTLCAGQGACRFETAAGIRLGGFRISDGKRLFDETLDARLEAERAAFPQQSGLAF